MKLVIIVYSTGKWDILYMSKDQTLPMIKQQEAVWWAEEFMDRRNMPVTPADYTFQLKEAAQESITAVSEVCLAIRACCFCEHFDDFGEGRCNKFSMQAPWLRALDCAHFSLTEQRVRDMGWKIKAAG